MIICHCRNITDRDVRRVAASGASARCLFAEKGHANCCGSCCATIRTMLSESVTTTACPGSENQ